MKVKVNQERCIACGGCLSLAPEVFDFDDSGLAYCKVEDVNEDSIDMVEDAIGFCPGSAISEVKED